MISQKILIAFVAIAFVCYLWGYVIGRWSK